MDRAAPTSDLDTFLSELVSAQLADQVLTEMEIRGNDLGLPLIGRAVGRYLELQTRSIDARHVVDLGGNGGYSTWWFAGALGGEGRVTLAARDPAELAAAESALRRASRFAPVTTTSAPPTEVLAGLAEPVDLVHLHAEVVRGADGLAVFEAAVGAVRPGGQVLVTGVTPGGVPDAAGVAVCRAAADDPALVSSVVPIRDGVLVALRTAPSTAPR